MFNIFRAGPGMPAQEIVTKVNAGEMILIDVRDPMEVHMSGRAKGALEIPLNEFQGRLDPRSTDCVKELTLDTPIALYCASGARSGMAMRAMQQLGYKNVYNLGGLHDWQAAGGEMA